MKNNIKPIFLFSLPRSGSTLLQTILTSHSEITSASEPWLLLPLIYMLKERGTYTEYGHNTSVRALVDLFKEMENGEKDYKDELKNFVLRIYKKISKKNTTYFLDKTPRYHLIAKNIIEIFPDAKYIFLWRNPISIIASMIDTFGNGKWQLFNYKIDLFTGFNNLITTYQEYKNKVYSIRYENLIIEPKKQLKSLFQFLDLPIENNSVPDLQSIALRGRLGDKHGIRNYKNLSEEPLNKWKKTICNPLRKKWSKYYLNWIGDEKLSLIGYNKKHILADVDNNSYSNNMLISDCTRLFYGILFCGLDLQMIHHKIRIFPSWKNIYAHK